MKFARQRWQMKLGCEEWSKLRIVKRNLLRAVHWMTLGVFEDILYVRRDY